MQANVGVIPKKFLYWGAQHSINNGDRKFYGLNEATPGFTWRYVVIFIVMGEVENNWLIN